MVGEWTILDTVRSSAAQVSHMGVRRPAIQVMSENPYRLARDIRGIGFKTADAIAGVSVRATRKPKLLLRLAAVFQLRTAERPMSEIDHTPPGQAARRPKEQHAGRIGRRGQGRRVRLH
jgi:hypothetical protein